MTRCAIVSGELVPLPLLTSKELSRVSAVALELVNAARVIAGHRVVDKWLPGFRCSANVCPVGLLLNFGSLESHQPLVSPALIVYPRIEYAEPVAEAWGRHVIHQGDSFHDSFQVVVPIALRNFIRLFDLGFYPELVKEVKYAKAVAA